MVPLAKNKPRATLLNSNRIRFIFPHEVSFDILYKPPDNSSKIITPSSPFISSIKTLNAKNVLHEWLEDELKLPTGTNKAIEGADSVAAARVAPARLSNSFQILEGSFKISGTLDAVTPIGRQSVLRHETNKSMKHLSHEREYAAINNAASAA